jgi:hypothetical protein
MTAADFRRIALSMPGAVEGSHMGNADFRVNGRIFATLSLERQGFGVLKLVPEQQLGMVQDAPEIFSPVPGGWGRMGMTRVLLANVTEDVLEGALRTAWNNIKAEGQKQNPIEFAAERLIPIPHTFSIPRNSQDFVGQVGNSWQPAAGF